MGGNPSAGENRWEKQAGDVLPGPRKSLCCSNPASFTRPAEIVAAWSVEDGVRVVWEVAKMVVVVVVVVVVLLVWIQNNDRTEKWLTKDHSPLNHTISL